MTVKEENKYSMYNAVRSFSEDTAWTGITGTVSGLAAAYTTHANNTIPIESCAQGQSTSRDQAKGATQDKKERREALVVAVNAVSGPLYAHGHLIGDNEIKAVADVSPSSLRSMRDDLLTSRASSVLAIATTHSASLQALGATATQLSALETARDAWAAGTQRPRSRKATAAAFTGDLATCFKTADDHLKNVLDRLMLPFKATHPSYYTAYQAARVIHDNAAKKKKKPQVPPAPGPTP